MQHLLVNVQTIKRLILMILIELNDTFNIGSSNRDFRTLTVDNGHLVEATSVKLVVIYSVCFAKSPWMDIAFHNTCE